MAVTIISSFKRLRRPREERRDIDLAFASPRLSIVHRLAHQILKPTLAIFEVYEGQSNITLALIRCIVHSYQQALTIGMCQANARKQSQVQLASQAGTHSSNCHWPSCATG